MATKKSAAVKFLDGLIGAPMTLGRMLTSIRREDETSLAALAKRLGVSRQHLHAVEADRAAVSVARAARWAKILGYDPLLFVELTLQSEIQAAGLKARIKVEAA